MAKHLVVALVHAPLATFEFGCVTEIFGLPRKDVDVEWYDFATATSQPGLIASTGGINILIENGLEILDRADTIIVPSWSVYEVPSDTVLNALHAAHARGARLLSICSGAFLLAATGILDGRRATTHWRYADELARRYPQIQVEPDVLYIDEADVVTAAGSAAGLDMMLHVIRRDHGRRACNVVARRLNVPPYREGGQRQFVQRPVPQVRDTRLAGTIEWMRRHANANLRTEELASMAAMSQRTFFRKFREATGMAPYDWLIQERVAIAKELLEEGRLSIEQVAIESGFGAAETLRHHFRRLVGSSPADYRRSFGGTLPELVEAA